MDNSKLHIVAVTGFLKNDKDQYLILKRSDKEIAFPSKWTVPGGKVESGDGIKKTLKKEFLEETGLEIKDKISFLGEYDFTRPDGYHVIGIGFVCEYESGEVKMDEQDFTEYAWMSLDELDNFDLIDGVRKDFEKIKSSLT